jgi:signal transduction histidine kinase
MKSVAILLVEDRAEDALLLASRLEAISAVVTHVTTEPAFRAALSTVRFDAILSDYQLPGFGGEQALAIARELAPDLPFLFVSGALADERAIELLKAGATDYVLKDSPHRLLPSLERALREADERRTRRAAEEETHRRVELDQLLVGIVSHDLRNPLAAIQVAARTLLEFERLEPTAERSVSRIVSAATRAERLIRNLLDLTEARLGSGIAVVPQRVDLTQVALAVMDELHATFSDRRIDFHAPGPVHGTWDADRMGQVISNLVTNAVHHGGGSAVEVRVTAEGDAALLEVHNDGPPIPPEVLPRIFFEAMQRGADRRGGMGVGLGLFIVDQIARAHGGTVEVTSTAEQGTTFRLRVPRGLAAIPVARTIPGLPA